MKYKCKICGRIIDEEEMGIALNSLKHCPTCKQSVEEFVPVESDEEEIVENSTDLAYDHLRKDSNIRYMNTIHEIAVTGESPIASMCTLMEMPNWDDILILGCQLNPHPLENDVPVNTQTIIGKNAEKPMVLETPIYVTHMSYGALSKETKIALAKGTAMAKTAVCSGEGGILPEELNNSYKYIFEYVPNQYSVTDENLQKSSAIEIKIGQGTKPGLGGQLQGAKVTKEIADVRGKPIGEDIHSPTNIPGVETKDDLKELVSELRNRSNGRPIGLKIAAGRIEDDLDFALYSDPDFITFDGRGGATGASPKLVRDSTSIPTIYALSRARKYLDEHASDVSLIITGGLRVSSDFAKALAMGADGIAIGSAALIATACQQYRICDTGECPVGVATQNKQLRERLKIDHGSARLYNFLKSSTEDLKTFARITGHDDIHEMDIKDLATFNSEISNYTQIKHT